MRLPMGHGTRSAGIRQFALALAGIVAVTGCAPVSSPQDAGLVSASVPQGVVTQIVNNTCDDEEPQEESLSTGSVKGLSKVKNGFGIPYDEYAQEYVCPPVPVTDDSYEANKNRGIGYAGIEDHYAGALAPGQTHSPDHPEHEDVGAFDALRDLTTNEEKYGCCMRWEYAGWVGGPTGHSVSGDVGVDGYLDFLNGNGSGHKQYVAIHALKTNKWVICCPYDYGPATELSVSGSGKYGRIGGVSPQAAEDLGLGGGDCPDENLTEWWWVENSSQVECGPVSDLSRLTTGNESPSPAPSNTATVSTRVSTGLAGAIASQGAISDSQQVSVAPANANSFVQATDPAWCHGDLPRSAIRYVVFQDTNAGTEDAIGALARWRDVGFQSVPHFIVGRDGTITQCVPLDRIAHHAGSAPAGANAEFGVSPERDDTPPDGLTDSAMDAWSVGMALVHERDDGEYPKAQLDALDRLVAYVREQSEAKEPPILITKGEWRDGKRLGKQSEGDMVENTEEADVVESPEALMRAQAREARDPEGQTGQVVVPASESSVPQSEIDAMGQSVTSEFPTEEYASSENHSGTTTMGDVRVARESGECSDEKNAEANPDAGGTGIAKRAVALSGTATPRGYITGKWDEVPTDGRLSDYVSEKRRVYPDVPGWADCGRFAATCVKASGADESFPAHMDTAYQYAYMTKTPKWNRVGTLRPGDSPDSLCRPGDVLVTEGKGHIMIYVGNDAVREKYPNSEANMAEASMGAYYGWCYRSVALSGTKAYAIFRCSNPDNATMGEGAPVSGLQGVVIKAKEFLGRPYYSVRDWRLSTYKDPNCPKTDCSGLVLWAYYQALGVDIVKQGGRVRNLGVHPATQQRRGVEGSHARSVGSGGHNPHVAGGATEWEPPYDNILRQGRVRQGRLHPRGRKEVLRDRDVGGSQMGMLPAARLLCPLCRGDRHGSEHRISCNIPVAEEGILIWTHHVGGDGTLVSMGRNRRAIPEGDDREGREIRVGHRMVLLRRRFGQHQLRTEGDGPPQGGRQMEGRAGNRLHSRNQGPGLGREGPAMGQPALALVQGRLGNPVPDRRHKRMQPLYLLLCRVL